jgi:outer membrane protein assembly factor BamB
MHGAALTDPIRINRAAIVADGSGRVAAFNTITGALLWMQAAPPWGPIGAQPAAGEGYAFVASQDQALYGFEHTTGQFWRYLTQSKLIASPVTIDQMVFQIVDGQLMSFDVYTGQLLWTQEQVVGKPLLRSGKTLMVVRDQRIDMLNVDDGAALGGVDLPQADRILTDQAMDGSLLIINDDGRVARLTAIR